MDQGIIAKAKTIKNETAKGANTADRVGSLFLDIINYIALHEEQWSTDTGGGEGGSSFTPGNLIQSLNNLSNPIGSNKILLFNGSYWDYTDKPSGGGGSGDVTREDLYNALADYVPKTATWWGNSINGTSVSGNLTGSIGYIEFSNGVRIGVDSNTNTLKVYRNDGTNAHIYATGEVSALGYSSSGGDSGGDPVIELGGLLTKMNNLNSPNKSGYLHYDISNDTFSWETLDIPTLGVLLTDINTKGEMPSSSGKYLYWDGTKYTWGEGGSGQGASLGSMLTALNNDNPTPSNGQYLYYNNGRYSWATIDPGTNVSLNISGNGNAFTSASLSNGTLTLTKGSIFATQGSLATVATSGSYNDLSNKPSIPAAQIQSNWTQTNTSAKDYIKNKPTIPTVPTNVSAFTNDAGYLTSSSNLLWDRLTGVPTTLSGYGITDAYTKSYCDGKYVTLDTDQTITGKKTFTKLTTFEDAIVIGGGKIAWDSAKNSLYVQGADGSVCHFYSLGVLSALGIGTDTDGSINQLALNELDVTRIRPKTSGGCVYIYPGDSISACVQFLDDPDNYAHNCYMTNFYKSGLCGENDETTESWKILPSGAATFSAVKAGNASFEDGTVYLNELVRFIANGSTVTLQTRTSTSGSWTTKGTW